MNASTERANLVPIHRIFTCIVTDGNVEVGQPGFEGSWVIKNASGQLSLLPIQSLLSIPLNAVFTISPAAGLEVLQRVKAELDPNMTLMSCLQICVAHTEALIEPDGSNFHAEASLFPVSYIMMGEMQMQQAVSVRADIKPPLPTEADVSTPAVDAEQAVEDDAAPVQEGDDMAPKIDGVAPSPEGAPTL